MLLLLSFLQMLLLLLSLLHALVKEILSTLPQDLEGRRASLTVAPVWIVRRCWHISMTLEKLPSSI